MVNFLVMEPTSNNYYFLFLYLVHKAMLTVDPSGPATGQLKPQRLWFASSFKRCATDFFNES